MRLIGVEYEAAMPGRTTALLFATALLGLIGGIAVHARNAHQAPAADQPLSEQERARLLATGKELFMARCARCHDERGDKSLKTGPPLNERGLSSEQIAWAVSGRLRDKTEEERRAVTLYISSLMKTKVSEEKHYQNLSPSTSSHPQSARAPRPFLWDLLRDGDHHADEHPIPAISSLAIRIHLKVVPAGRAGRGVLKIHHGQHLLDSCCLALG